MSIEAMKQWLEALENAREYIQAEHDQRKEMYERYGMVHKYSTEAQNLLDNKQAITSLRQVIEQAEKQEPVADLVECGNCHEGLSDMDHVCKKCLGAGWVRNPDTIPQPQREWVGLTDEEVQTCWDNAVNAIAPHYSIARTIETKLKEKNT